jgi:hypothetical protein
MNRANNFADAAANNRAAQDDLDSVKAGKRAAALKNPQADHWTQNANGPRPGANAFDRLGGPRTTS